MSEPVLKVKGLTKLFPLNKGLLEWNKPDTFVHAAEDVNFEIYAGEVLGFVGESGCGKSTIALAVMGLLPSSAAITI